MQPHLLYVEDDESLSFVTRDNLELKGYRVTHKIDGRQAKDFIESDLFEVDLCILDVMLPEIDGFQLAQIIRQRNQEVPILFLTARSLKEDRIAGLKLGADDYITKPFSIEELLLKIEIFLRRSKINEQRPPTLQQIGQYAFDHKNLTLVLADQSRQLTQREADLLLLFAQNQNEILKRSEILTKIWGEDDYFLGRSLDVFISRLRKYLKEDPALKIENIHGVGFRLKSTQPAKSAL